MRKNRLGDILGAIGFVAASFGLASIPAAAYGIVASPKVQYSGKYVYNPYGQKIPEVLNKGVLNEVAENRTSIHLIATGAILAGACCSRRFRNMINNSD